MSKSTQITLIISIAFLTASCQKDSEQAAVTVDSFPETEVLECHAVSFDTIPGQIGAVAQVDSNYMFYLYSSEHYLMLTDMDFNITGYTARKGNGPGEVTAISTLFGDLFGNGKAGFCDPFKRQIFAFSTTDPKTTECIADFSGNFDVPEPLYTIRLSDGRYLIAPMNYEYGLWAYDSATDSIGKWEAGYGLPKEQEQLISSGRWIAYNRNAETIGEFYTRLPLVILRSTDGTVKRVLQYGEIPEYSTITDDSPSLINDLALTDNCVFCLPTVAEDATEQPVLITDYNGTGIARLIIRPTSSICVDTVGRRIITANPEADDEVVSYYDLPDWLEL